MKKSIPFIAATVACVLLTTMGAARAQGTAFSYQGRLNTNGVPVNGTFDFVFALYNAPGARTEIGTAQTNLAVPVVNGLFTVTNDFGGVFDGTTLWLEIGARTNGSGTFTILSPREQLTPAPYAVYAENANAAGLTGTVPLAQLPSALSLLTDPGTGNVFVGKNTGNASLTGTHNTATGSSALDLVTTGGGNTADGYTALEKVTIGDFNTAIGYQALLNNVSGFNNTAAGVNALFTSITASDNTAVGLGALQDTTTGSNNVAIGFQALLSNQNGNNNIAVGYLAGQNVTSGSNDIYIGNSGNGESGIIRIGTPTLQTDAYIAGTVHALQGLNVDLSDQNTGILSSNSLRFGNASGEGIASKRTGSNPNDLEFYTSYNRQMIITQGGNVGIGTNTPSHALEVNGTISCSILTINGGSDLAEPFNISPTEGKVTEGTVVVIDDKNPGRLKLSDRAYDARVAGVISGANGIHPGIQMQQQGLLEGGQNVALTGRVYVQADTSNGAIKPGDLLTTSKNPGRAMRVTNHAKAQGAILGKAMTGLGEANGLVLVLVTLQ